MNSSAASDFDRYLTEFKALSGRFRLRTTAQRAIQQENSGDRRPESIITIRIRLRATTRAELRRWLYKRAVDLKRVVERLMGSVEYACP
ncbi:MAG TPA: hypothetical protein VFR18_27285, partial [Terriglobia bacterium]|nr:hypothetical protein [Terriglobia bacterium]